MIRAAIFFGLILFMLILLQAIYTYWDKRSRVKSAAPDYDTHIFPPVKYETISTESEDKAPKSIIIAVDPETNYKYEFNIDGPNANIQIVETPRPTIYPKTIFDTPELYLEE